MKTPAKIRTKKGITSFFITVIVMLILTVFMVGFARLMVAEAHRTSNNDLSQSAYDSALAGIEDAKVALLKYHQCLSDGYNRNSPGECGPIIARMQDGIKSRDCDTVNKVLGRQQSTENHGTIIQETQSTSQGGVAADMVQAYTCVTIEEELSDYRTTIGTDSRVRIIPIRSELINSLGYIDIAWYSLANSNGTTPGYSNDDWLYPLSNVTSGKWPPLLSVNLFQADATFSLSQLSTARADSNTDRGTLYLKPVGSTGSGTNSISDDVVAKSADKHKNTVTKINCSTATADGFWCHAKIKVPKTWLGGDRNEGASFILLSLPYGTPETDIRVALYTTTNSPILFTGVQARVDATGRANDLFRRIETRIELVDTYFPYPEFTIQMGDTTGDTIKKTFYTTGTCWLSDNGTQTPCDNYKEDTGLSSY